MYCFIWYMRYRNGCFHTNRHRSHSMILYTYAASRKLTKLHSPSFPTGIAWREVVSVAGAPDWVCCVYDLASYWGQTGWVENKKSLYFSCTVWTITNRKRIMSLQVPSTKPGLFMLYDPSIPSRRQASHLLVLSERRWVQVLNLKI